VVVCTPNTRAPGWSGCALGHSVFSSDMETLPGHGKRRRTFETRAGAEDVTCRQ
jgi:hypothetical protein